MNKILKSLIPSASEAAKTVGLFLLLGNVMKLTVDNNVPVLGKLVENAQKGFTG